MVQYLCICCDGTVNAETPSNALSIHPVYGGLIFRSTGNYGSTIFDPMPICSEEYLQVIICDSCVRSKAKRVKHIFNVKKTYAADYRTFEPDKEEEREGDSSE